MARKLSLREIQQRELNILIRFAQFCEQNQLNYMLIGGTLLGAVRHQGFIPWDDDVDVAMPRSDYDRILNGDDFNYQALAEYEICHWKNDTLAYPFIKIVDNHTTVHLKYTRDSMEVGRIWIDVFPIDGNPADEGQSRKIYQKVGCYRKLLMLQIARVGEGKTWYKKCLKPIGILFLKAIPHKYLCRKMDELAKKYNMNDSGYAGGIIWGSSKERMRKEEYMETVLMEFEGTQFKTMAGYEKYLRNKYGDYMQLPPLKERETHSMEAYEN